MISHAKALWRERGGLEGSPHKHQVNVCFLPEGGGMEGTPSIINC